MKSAIAIRHVQFENLGTFETVLANAGYAVRYHDIVDAPPAFDPIAADLVVVLGGPVGVYEQNAYPFLLKEREILKARLDANRPTFGICLGAQLVAAAMGAKVSPSGVREIGFSTVSLTEAGHASPLGHLADVPVFHWHGDTFEIPAGAVRLAATDLCKNQGFARGPKILGLQFHPEPDAADLERWLVGYAGDLAAAGIDPRMLRTEAARLCPAMRKAAREMVVTWLGGLKP
jgi:GMP synthase (glutamine-hydrolysing)